MNSAIKKSKRKIDHLRSGKNSKNVFYDQENNILWHVESDSSGYRLSKEIVGVIRV